MIEANEVVTVTFKFRDREESYDLRADEAWEVAQALKRMYPELLKPFQVPHEKAKHPLMFEGFMKIYRALTAVGINPR